MNAPRPTPPFRLRVQTRLDLVGGPTVRDPTVHLRAYGRGHTVLEAAKPPAEDGADTEYSQDDLLILETLQHSAGRFRERAVFPVLARNTKPFQAMGFPVHGEHVLLV